MPLPGRHGQPSLPAVPAADERAESIIGSSAHLLAPLHRAFAMSRRLRLQLTRQDADEMDQVLAQQTADVAQFDQVQASCTALDIADERLWPAHLLRQLGLSELCLVTQLPQLLSQQVELGTVDGFGHGAVCRRGAPSYIPVSEIENLNQDRPAMGHETTPALGRHPGKP